MGGEIGRARCCEKTRKAGALVGKGTEGRSDVKHTVRSKTGEAIPKERKGGIAVEDGVR